ncbi:MAG: MgtC/SapB family protein [Clostridia bacterium]|nr:MgtC/SapB family protein [Clostridia bacterium]
MLHELYKTLHDFNVISGTLRLILALLCGGIIGYERGKKQRPAGTRTYMMVCLGAALSILLAFSFDQMLKTVWHGFIIPGTRPNTDVSRFGAKVINGIGFLGAGTIIVTSSQKIKGITTAAGLFATACMGFAIGAGYYLPALLGCFLMWLTMTQFNFVEKIITSRTKNMNIYVEINDLSDIAAVAKVIRNEDITIYDIETKKPNEIHKNNPAAIFTLRLPKNTHHAIITSKIASIDKVLMIEEV